MDDGLYLGTKPQEMFDHFIFNRKQAPRRQPRFVGGGRSSPILSRSCFALLLASGSFLALAQDIPESAPENIQGASESVESARPMHSARVATHQPEKQKHRAPTIDLPDPIPISEISSFLSKRAKK